jgi:hypothetical protein
MSSEETSFSVVMHGPRRSVDQSHSTVILLSWQVHASHGHQAEAAVADAAVNDIATPFMQYLHTRTCTHVLHMHMHVPHVHSCGFTIMNIDALRRQCAVHATRSPQSGGRWPIIEHVPKVPAASSACNFSARQEGDRVVLCLSYGIRKRLIEAGPAGEDRNRACCQVSKIDGG